MVRERLEEAERDYALRKDEVMLSMTAAREPDPASRRKQ